MAIRKGKYHQLADREWLYWEYVEKQRSCADIAAEVGCDRATVEYRLHRHGIPVRGRYPGQWKDKRCATCGELFTPTGPAQRYCSLDCRPDSLTCQQCGTTFKPRSADQTKKGTTYKRKFCTEECRRAWQEENTRRRWANKDGYIVIPDPTMSRRINKGGYVDLNIGEREGSNNGRVLEHRWVMEQRLGRRLYPHEEVHHKHGNKDQNDRFCPACGAEVPWPYLPDTSGRMLCPACWHHWEAELELWTTSQPKGQRVEDKIAWAVKFLAEYGYAVTEP